MSAEFNPQFKKIGEILVHEGKITESDLEKTLSSQKNSSDKIGTLLVNAGYITEDELVHVYSMQLGYKAVSEDELFNADPEAVRLIPEDFAKQNRILALKKNGGSLIVAMEDPENLVGVDSLKRHTDLNPEIYVAPPSSLSKALEDIYGKIRKSGEVEEAIEGIRVISGDEDHQEEVDLSPDKASSEDAPIVKLVNLILQEAIKERATDIHIEPQQDSVDVRIRIDGVLQVIMTPPTSSLSGLVTRIKILSKLNIAERRLSQDGRFGIKTSTKDIDVRVSILPTVYGEKVVMRLLDKSGFDFNLGSLGFEKDMYHIFKKVISQPYGMVMVSGPTGSGKSTSLYASLKEIKNENTNITTVEDPVEYQLEGINQVQVNDDIGLTFASTLRSILRQDPDILLIGEIRDEETADIAVKFSLTGHLVFSTVHANDAASTITRLLDIGLKPFLVGSCVNLVMAQRLVRRICENCKEQYTPDKEVMELLGSDADPLKGKKLVNGKGCNNCRNTGYHGRIGIFELIAMSRDLRQMVFENASEDDIRAKSIEEGMVSLRDNGIRKVVDGITTVEEVLRSTVTDI
ncbi:MAG: ATPase, T2SS/T4P/T4SS family [Candidatus Marinimicrobia bacterium]|nr:ATPase, T2SS/T4P/T4SS family [Candidatus Neomarinimicrobiota bacterium]MDP7072767.1 ATPase, T2SS/T4P/T4SS family [Candidatus Neomarinimicrobiota bacterium]